MAGPLQACEACGPLAEAGPCKAAFLQSGSEQAQRIPFGVEQHLLVVDPVQGGLAAACPSCRTPRGGIHHARCRLEECPTCAGPAWNCRCVLDRLVAI